MSEQNPEADTLNLQSTPTWAVAAVCFVLIAVSLLMNYGLNLLVKYLNKRRRKSLTQALGTIKSELMQIGFMTLLLSMSQRRIVRICIPKSVGETFLPCQGNTADSEEDPTCAEQDKLSLLSREGVQQLQLLLFVLAFFHVFMSFITFSLGMAKMKRWESWEAETRTLDYEFSNDPRRIQLIHQTTFGRRHLQFWSENRYLRLPVCFLRQFYGSVSKADYTTLRHGFIAAHFAEGSKFDFQKYLRRALDKDFGVVVGISFWIWFFSVVFIFLNAPVFYDYFWLPFIPLVMQLIVGTKLQSIITRMCLDTSDRSNVIRGTLLVRPSDHLFWFGRPKLLLHLMHFILFQNSFQLAFFTWAWFKFGFLSCFHRETEDVVIKLAMSLVAHVLCGYVTLPLYALVTQMGTSMREGVFTEGVDRGLKRWQAAAKKNLAKKNRMYNNLASRSLDASVTSLDSSLSFSTHDPSFVVDLDNISPDGGFSTEGEVLGDEDSSVAGERTEHHQQEGTFDGFHSSKSRHC